MGKRVEKINIIPLVVFGLIYVARRYTFSAALVCWGSEIIWKSTGIFGQAWHLRLGAASFSV
jgi:hypothetical protein